MRDVVVVLARSRKAWVLLLVVLGVVTLNLAGRVSGEQALETLKWLVSAWFGAVALEDAAEKYGAASAGPLPGDEPAQDPDQTPRPS